MMSPLGAILAFFTVSFFRRRYLFISCQFLMGGCYVMQTYEVIKKKDNMDVLFMCLTVIFYQISTGAGVWTYLSEIGNEVSLGLAMLALNISTTALSIPANSMMDKWGVDGMFKFFAGLNFFCGLVLLFIMKETKGLTYEQ